MKKYNYRLWFFVDFIQAFINVVLFLLIGNVSLLILAVTFSVRTYKDYEVLKKQADENIDTDRLWSQYKEDVHEKDPFDSFL